MPSRFIPLAVRFKAKIGAPDLSGCWPWLGTKKLGYGIANVNRRQVCAHRVALKIFKGVEVDPEMTVDHLCGNRGCVNPAHLDVCSRGENARRAMTAITHCRQGHPFDVENTRYRPNGYRRCKACELVRDKRSRAKQRARAALSAEERKG